MDHDYRPGADRLAFAPVPAHRALLRPVVVLVLLSVVTGAVSACAYDYWSGRMAHPNEQPTVAAILNCQEQGRDWENGKCS